MSEKSTNKLEFLVDFLAILLAAMYASRKNLEFVQHVFLLRSTHLVKISKTMHVWNLARKIGSTNVRLGSKNDPTRLRVNLFLPQNKVETLISARLLQTRI